MAVALGVGSDRAKLETNYIFASAEQCEDTLRCKLNVSPAQRPSPTQPVSWGPQTRYERSGSLFSWSRERVTQDFRAGKTLLRV